MNDNIYDENNLNVENGTSQNTNENANDGYEVEELLPEGMEVTEGSEVTEVSRVPEITEATEVSEVTEGTAAASPQSEVVAHDTRYDKYASPAGAGLTFNGRRANFNPYTGERLNASYEQPATAATDASHSAAAGSTAYSAASDASRSAATGNTAYSAAADASRSAATGNAAYSAVPGYAPAAARSEEYTERSASHSATPEFTYGSGAPVQVETPQSTYVSSYGTIYKGKDSETGRKKRRMPAWLKVLLSAAAFGIIAAAVFIGTNKLYDKLTPSDTPTVNQDSASGKRNIINPVGKNSDDSSDNTDASVSQVKKGDNDGAVASAQILTGNESTYTDVSAVVENSLPSIVQINCTFNTQSFFGTYRSTGAGSGIIIGQTDTELMIATNNHVVENALDVKVTFNDGTDAEAVVKGTDASADLAVVAVDISELSNDTINNIKVAIIGDSDNVKVGQMAIAIGNALGYGTSTTVGYISAKDREVEVDGRKMTLLQTDAAINPGNSGGALPNIKGDVIGINNVKYASAEVEGMGFAIPISRAVDILNELASREVLKDNEKGYLGVKMQTVTSDFATAYGWPEGVYVNTVMEGSAAEKAGILSGDIITKLNGITVQTTTDLRNEITSYKVGTEVTITLQRLNRGRFTEMEVKVTLGANPEYSD